MTQPLSNPSMVRRRFDRLSAVHERLLQDKDRITNEDAQLTRYLHTAPAVTQTLELLGEKLFESTLKLVREQLTIALQEVLEQPIQVQTEKTFRNGTIGVAFYIERDGKREHVLKGQGGSVVNILSVGLRLLALASLDPAEHRPFLVLDEQDCWLRPELVPRLAKLVQQAAEQLGFQVLVISHHDTELFRSYADKVYRLEPGLGGARVIDETDVHQE